MDNLNYKAFTLKSPVIVPSIITDIGVSLPFGEELIEISDERIYNTKAIWDTGATHCVITKKVAEVLKLEPIGTIENHHAGGVSIVNQYLVNLYLPNNIVIPFHKVIECNNVDGSFGILIGMDIIRHSDFAITNMNHATTFSIRFPSMQTIDYVEEWNKTKDKMFRNVGRNDKCPCGSGKKFKNCHGI